MYFSIFSTQVCDLPLATYCKVPIAQMVRCTASASGAGCRGFDPGPRHTKGVKNGTSGYLVWRSAL